MPSTTTTQKQHKKTTIEFLKPTTTTGGGGNENSSSFVSLEKLKQQREEGFFPPTIFSDAIYSNGIRVFPTSVHETTIDDDDDDSSSSAFVVDVGSDDYILQHNTNSSNSTGRRQRNYGGQLKCAPNETYPYNTTNSLPMLNPDDVKLWHHRKAAAKFAVEKHFPMQVYRLLGVITREVTVQGDDDDDDSSLGPCTELSQYSFELPPTADDHSTKKRKTKTQKTRKQTMSMHMAMTEARAELAAVKSNDYYDDDHDGSSMLEARAEQIQRQWNAKLQRGVVQKGWDKHGQIPCEAANDPNYVPLPLVRDWMKRRNVVDDSSSPSHVSLYDGIHSIPNDLETIVDSLLELSSPKDLYMTPLLLPYTVMESVEETSVARPQNSRGDGPVSKKRKLTSTNRKWKIRIGVYANRLLAEVNIVRSLHIVMTALDDGSFRVTEPLHLTPPPKEAVFESAPTPIVMLDELDNSSNNNNVIIIDDDSDDEEKKSDDNIVDLTIEDSTRDESRISAFTIKGFLKMIENCGNDISNWPMIESKITPLLKLNLMLHQRHAICWMLRMESLGGFGINSIFWEEREFLDGGRYYYSPALGQLRLSQPPVMKGGILADEQGLGKTLEVVGLVAATLDDLKLEATDARETVDNNGLSPTHATLIVVPPALVSQWMAEVRKTVGDALDVHFFNHKSLVFEGHKVEGKDPDIVITTYMALQSNRSSRVLSGFEWGRIVLDEMQEVRCSTSKIAKNCDNLVCERRWMVSGTPLFDGITDLRGELNFLRLEPFAAGLEDGFFDLMIANHWGHRSLHGIETLRTLGNLILRRSKSMTIVKTREPLLGLPPLTVEFVPVHQDPSERAAYCFIESIVSNVLNGDSDSETVASRAHCLHILREMSISSILLTGGMGASSQLKSLHRWMQGENRRHLSLMASSNNGVLPTHGLSFPFPCRNTLFSCDEAIQYLSSAHEYARVGDDFVTTQTLGFGIGGTSRNRVAEDHETQLNEAKENMEKATNALNCSMSKKFKSLWHLALEKITTGEMTLEESSRASRSFVFLWKVRSTVISSCDRRLSDSEAMPSLLLRGWRPSFTRTDLYERRPTFAWAHPRAFQLDSIPSSVSGSDVKSSILALLEGNEDVQHVMGTTNYNRVNVVVNTTAREETWNATLQFADEEDSKLFRQKASSADGIALQCKENVAQVQTTIALTNSKLIEASAAYKAFPIIETQRELSIANKEHKRALLGLRIVLRRNDFPLHLRATRSLGPTRSMEPHLAADLCDVAHKAVSQCNLTIQQKSTCLEAAKDRVEKIQKTLSRQVSSHVQALTVFETIEALSNDETHKTKCPICLCNLGVAPDSNNDEQSALIAMTHCLHVYCAECMKKHANRTRSTLYCPSCRREIDPTRPIILIDREKTEDRDALEERREQAKVLVQKVARMLDESNGQLDSQTWQDLYHSIDLPPNADCSRHPRYNAIPGHFLAHLRTATRIKLDSLAHETSHTGIGDDAGLSSKVRALLADLPLRERSVIFSESKSAVKHLMFVLEKRGIGCRALFVGQAISDAEVALQDWKSTMLDPRRNVEFIPFPVLIIQAGAAASGLTLTASCKMFLLEPFTRMEEEQQAYARCHRYGQEKAVQVKCYYAPVSVESRLLEWRKRASSGNIADTKVVYSPVAHDMCVDDDRGGGGDMQSFNENEAEQNRTKFLLGLTGEGD